MILCNKPCFIVSNRQKFLAVYSKTVVGLFTELPPAVESLLLETMSVNIIKTTNTFSALIVCYISCLILYAYDGLSPPNKPVREALLTFCYCKEGHLGGIPMSSGRTDLV